jgi:hypothetical protein
MSDRMPWILWPFWAVWKLLETVLKLTGRLVALALGLALLISGVVLCFTVLGLPVGLPLAAVGLLLLVRGLF